MSVLRRVLHPRRWSSTVRRLVAVVLVFNVALGLAFSIIGLRHQADDRAAVQIDLTQRMVLAQYVDAQVWRSVGSGAVTAGLAEAPLDRLSTWASSSAHHGSSESAVSGQAYVASVSAVRAALAQGNPARARGEARLGDERLSVLITAMNAVAVAHQRDSDRASLTADVETVVLMLFAAGMGLLLFRRSIAARVNGDLRAARARARAEARFGSLVRHSSDLISIVEIDFTITYQSPSVQVVLGYEPDHLTGTGLLELVHPDDRHRMIAAHDSVLDGSETVYTTTRMRTADGAWRHVESVHTDLREDENVGNIVITSRDVTDRMRLEEQLRHSVLHDDLTGLANRTLFANRVEHAIDRMGEGGFTPAVVFLDLDDFKGVNDTVGHQGGDQLLTVVAQRLAAAVRPGDTVARLGGDEFAVLIEQVGASETTEVVEHLRCAVATSVILGGRDVAVHASLGVAVPTPGQDVESVLAAADLAMYAAKAAGKDSVLTYTPDMGERALARLQLKTELAAALAAGQIRAWFQPTVDLGTGRLSGFEALARWEHPERGIIAPLDFVPMAEQTGLVVELGRQVLRQACRALVGWHTRHPDQGHLSIAVNLSARELEEPDLVAAVGATLAETGLSPAALTLEVTETLVMGDPERARAQLDRLRAIGVRIAIDDFGTGYSSLSYLEQFPVDIVKIDKSFVDRLDDGQPSVVIDSITQLAGALGMHTVAEGIEHSAQADLLRAVGCTLGQGYLWSRPVEADRVDELIAASARETRIDDLADRHTGHVA